MRTNLISKRKSTKYFSLVISDMIDVRCNAPFLSMFTVNLECDTLLLKIVSIRILNFF